MEKQYFDEMRQQMAALKEQLNKQEIFNDQFIREIMKVKTKDISKTKNVGLIAAIFVLIIYPWFSFTNFLSWTFTAATCAMIIFCAIATVYIHRPVDKLNYMTSDLATVARVMAKFKKQYDDWLHYVTPALLIPWISWACYEFAWKKCPEGLNPLGLTLPILLGAAIGGIIGYHFHRKAVNAAKSILEQIEEK
jgi:hypothetical protein